MVTHPTGHCLCRSLQSDVQHPADLLVSEHHDTEMYTVPSTHKSQQKVPLQWMLLMEMEPVVPKRFMPLLMVLVVLRVRLEITMALATLMSTGSTKKLGIPGAEKVTW